VGGARKTLVDQVIDEASGRQRQSVTWGARGEAPPGSNLAPKVF